MCSRPGCPPMGSAPRRESEQRHTSAFIENRALPVLPPLVRSCDGIRETRRLGTLPCERAGKNEVGARANQQEADGIIPCEWLAEIKHRERGKYRKRNDLLHDLELRRRIDGAAPAIGGHGKAVFEEGNQPTGEDHRS